MNLSSIDTNILVYAAGLRRSDADEPKIRAAQALIEGLIGSDEIKIAAQALAELRHVLTRRSGLSADLIEERLARYLALGDCIPTDQAVLRSAFELAHKHKLQTYDAIIVAAAAQAGCDALYSEDMQHGFVWRGVEVVNPFV